MAVKSFYAEILINLMAFHYTKEGIGVFRIAF